MAAMTSEIEAIGIVFHQKRIVDILTCLWKEVYLLSAGATSNWNDRLDDRFQARCIEDDIQD
jgi:hypothetical protein